MIEDHFGSDTWGLILEKVQIKNPTFSTHDRYSERIIPNLLTALAEVTGHDLDEIGITAGRYFIKFMMRYGYTDLLKVLGRRFSDFLKGLDSLHTYFHFSYPKLRAPSFYCDRETTEGVTLHYRSRRKGYVSYVTGQLLEIAKVFFEQDIVIEIISKEEKKGFQFVLLRIKFNNQDFTTDQALRERNTALNEFLPVDSVSVLQMFPYFIAFNKKLKVVVVGTALHQILPNMTGKKMDEEFDLVLPMVKFTWEGVSVYIYISVNPKLYDE